MSKNGKAKVKKSKRISDRPADNNTRQLHIHREPANGEYTAVTVHTETETIAVASRPDAHVALIDVLPPVSA